MTEHKLRYVISSHTGRTNAHNKDIESLLFRVHLIKPVGRGLRIYQQILIKKYFSCSAGYREAFNKCGVEET